MTEEKRNIWPYASSRELGGSDVDQEAGEEPDLDGGKRRQENSSTPRGGQRKAPVFDREMG